MAIQYKACPKCGKGDLFSEEDQYGSLIKCLQCGYSSETGRTPILLGKAAKYQGLQAEIDERDALIELLEEGA